MFLCAAEHGVCVNSFFLTYCPSLRDCGTKRGDKSIHCRKRNQQLGCRNHKRWKLCVGVRIHTRLVSSVCVFCRLFRGQGAAPVVSTFPRSLPKSVKKQQPPLPPPVRRDRPYLPFNKPHPPLLLSALLLSPLIFPSLICALFPPLLSNFFSPPAHFLPHSFIPLCLPPKTPIPPLFSLTMSPVANWP